MEETLWSINFGFISRHDAAALIKGAYTIAPQFFFDKNFRGRLPHFVPFFIRNLMKKKFFENSNFKLPTIAFKV